MANFWMEASSHFSFHYDESLTSGSTTGRYLVKSWNEIP